MAKYFQALYKSDEDNAVASQITNKHIRDDPLYVQTIALLPNHSKKQWYED
jgi:hypothetical protein